MGELFAGPGFRTCSRAGCQWPAVSTLGFDYGAKRAWLEELRPKHDPSTYDLCSVHSERFSPPMGWAAEDRRVLSEPLFHVPSEVTPVDEDDDEAVPVPAGRPIQMNAAQMQAGLPEV
jgi:hypothetical protein